MTVTLAAILPGAVVICTLLAMMAVSTDACILTIFHAAKDKLAPDDVVLDPGCYYAPGMFIHGTSGTSFELEDNSADNCIKACKEKEYHGETVAVQEKTCHCNKAFKRHSKRDADKCNIKCVGNEKNKCGGDNFVSVYTVP